jgi:phage/plasmid-associated DNA primase
MNSRVRFYTTFYCWLDTSVIDQYIEDILGKDQKKLFYQIPAIAIRDTDIDLEPSKICYFFKGDQHAGKDSSCNLLRKFFGDRVVTSISLRGLATNDFMKPLLEGKLLNMNDELPPSLPDLESTEIKSLTGTKFHTLNPKGEKPYQSVITASHIFASNHFPACNIEENEYPYWGRWEIIYFRKQFPINEKYNAGIFTEQNMSGLLNKVIVKMFEINDHGIKKQTKDAYTDWTYDSNSVFRFVRDVMVDTEEPNEYLKDDLFTYYKLYCVGFGNVEPEDTFTTLVKFGDQIINRCKAKGKRPRADDVRINVYSIHKKIKPEMLEKLQKLSETANKATLGYPNVKPPNTESSSSAEIFSDTEW